MTESSRLHLPGLLADLFGAVGSLSALLGARVWMQISKLQTITVTGTSSPLGPTSLKETCCNLAFKKRLPRWLWQPLL